ncbi:hypothetical protein E2C01_066702 [Portunus trituberculatus]|uniref:Uncharacterized protein n=1 Tax=Portunus trituberculatus TaxID=210409 RepID=A0A5B7HT20_PORTR|nr:hypothetical protein [Portunus trituberculatus]
MLELVRDELHVWDPKNEEYSKNILRRTTLDEIAATLRVHITTQTHLRCNHLEPGYQGDM